MNQHNDSSYHHGNLREALLQQAIVIIREKGVENLSLRALAREVGVSQTAPYRHFTDKNSLLAELATLAFTELSQVTFSALDSSASASICLQQAAHAYLNYSVSNPEKYRLMFGHSIQQRDHYPNLVQAGSQAFAMMTALIQQGQLNHEFIGGNCEHLSGSLWSSIHGFVLLCIDGLYTRLNLPKDPTEMLKQHIEMMLRSILK